ncbi:MAG: Mannonate dehydratase [uncultured Thermomicrobiales bacterium]|uniref:mannonate dehydratase n=1 Tax=uncultured Thermomicrobiales bacterium TaxID=1645740 RepID=A0A6J4VWI9_9BACT|nr:MAG: Mannonate dehydratase [uncultured Thermomicrobiales bacterium]
MDGNETGLGMRVAVGQMNELTDETLAYAAQLGVGGVQLNTPRLPGEARWETADLRALVDRCRAHGLRLEAIENVPIHFYDEAMLGLPRRDEQIEHYRGTIRHMGEAGIPILGYHFMPNSVWRTSRVTPGRGGSHVTSFDLALVGGTASEQRAFVAKKDERLAALPLFDDAEAVDEPTMWANYAYFMRAVLPVAEEAGVRLALHPDDPPVASLGGVARLFKDIAGFERALEIAAASPAWGLDLCLGCCSEMPGGATNVTAMIERFGPLGRIFYVHLRDVQGTVPRFQECFLGEGNYNPAAIVLALKRNGFDGFLLDDHVPAIVNDTLWGHRSRAHAIGYIQGLLKMMETTGAP